jgi:hypothetical protein
MRGRAHRAQRARPALGLEDLIAAPELAALKLLDHALHVATLAVLAQYPHLLGDEYGQVRHDGDPVALMAERLLDATAKLRPVLELYRRAVVDARHDRDDDDLPF